MSGAERRENMIAVIRQSEKPVPAKTLAKMFHVSRQVIVQDVALVRAAGYDILSTNRGYILQTPSVYTRVFKVTHTDEQLEDELCAIVDLGGKILNVMVNHRVYGRMSAELNISSRRKVQEFLDDIHNGKSSPLMKITSNYHYHQVEADSEETLDLIESMLREKGYIVRTVC